MCLVNRITCPFTISDNVLKFILAGDIETENFTGDAAAESFTGDAAEERGELHQRRNSRLRSVVLPTVTVTGFAE
ncbi:hypothetical protein HID58_065450 [Brassica napus]|uniref:Uncharacterized protein n=1 Tax=Brassica napus TaxID=3708 RepID=A0ABQ7ZCU2_BRANA|nr:hypothetical protein HID58_065450 [Brassica napus]